MLAIASLHNRNESWRTCMSSEDGQAGAILLATQVLSLRAFVSQPHQGLVACSSSLLAAHVVPIGAHTQLLQLLLQVGHISRHVLGVNVTIELLLAALEEDILAASHCCSFGRAQV